MNGVNTRFDVPHSRFNEITKAQFDTVKVKVLVEGKIGAHLCVSEDLYQWLDAFVHSEIPAQRVLLNMSIALKLHDCMTSQSLL
jgi:homoserine O-succinyltransferase